MLAALGPSAPTETIKLASLPSGVARKRGRESRFMSLKISTRATCMAAFMLLHFSAAAALSRGLRCALEMFTCLGASVLMYLSYSTCDRKIGDACHVGFSSWDE